MARRPLQVILASDRNSGAVRGERDDEKLERIFIIIPKDYTEKEVREKFEVNPLIVVVRPTYNRQVQAY